MVNQSILRLAGDFSEQDIERIRLGFCKKLGKEINFKIIVDNSLIGGFSAFIDGKVYDASILTQVNDMKRSFSD